MFWIFILYPALLFWYFAIQRFVFNKQVSNLVIPDQALLAFWITFGVFFPFMLYYTKHITEVRKDGIYIRFIPLNRSFKKIPFYIVQECKIQQYEFFKGKTAGQNSEIETNEEVEKEEGKGNEKVKAPLRKAGGAPVVILQLISGKKMLISSRQPEKLCKAIQEAAGRA